MVSLAVRRPLAVLMCVLIVLLFGSIALTNLPLDLMPNFDAPAITVTTVWPGAGPRDVEPQITKVLEKELASVNGLKSLSGYSVEGASVNVLHFDFGINMEEVLSQTRDKVDKAASDLPEGANRPLVEMVSLNARALATITISGTDEEQQMVDYAESVVINALERLSGVVTVELSGHHIREIHVDVIPSRLSRYGVNLSNIIGSLTLANLSFPYGEIVEGEQAITVRGISELESLQQVATVPVATATGSTIPLGDLAEISIASAPQSALFRHNGQPSLSLAVQKQQNSNTVRVMDGVIAEVARLNAANPEIQLTIIDDQSQFIRQSLGNVLSNLIGGGLLAVLVIYLFLRDVETSLIIATAIPISVIGAVAGLYFSGTTLNIVSLGGLALGIGMLVDNGIVVIESIFQHREAGESPEQSAILGTSQIAGAVVASTLTTVAVFIPVVFTEGISGIIFKDLSLAIVYSLSFSLLVALTFVPSLAALFGRLRQRFVTNPQQPSRQPRFLHRFMNSFGQGFDKLYTFYRDFLYRSLHNKRKVILAALGILVVSLLSALLIGFEFMPTISQNTITIKVNLPEGTQTEASRPYLEDVENRLYQISEIRSITSSFGGGSTTSRARGGQSEATFICQLAPISERRDNAQIAEAARRVLADFPDGGVQVSANDSIMDVVMGSGLSGFELTVKGPDVEVLQMLERQIITSLEKVPSLRNIQSTLAQSSSEARIRIDLKKAMEQGVNPQTAIALFRIAIDGNIPARATLDDQLIDVRVRLAPRYLSSLESLDYLQVPSARGTDLPLAAFARVERAPGVSSLNRIDREPGFTVTADTFGYNLNTSTSLATEQLREVIMPQGYTMNIGGDSEMMGEAFAGLANTLYLAVILVYMVMVAQFESLKLPLIIMFSIPFAMTGAIFGLVLFGRALSISSFIGLIMLAGIVVNNAIVLIDCIEQERKLKPDQDLYTVVAYACQIRLRPVLMTTLTTIVAMLPLALGLGEGSEIMAPMAAAVTGGLTLSTLVTLILIPTIYCIFESNIMYHTGR